MIEMMLNNTLCRVNYLPRVETVPKTQLNTLVRKRKAYLERASDIFRLDFVLHPHGDLALGVHGVDPNEQLVDGVRVIHHSVELLLNALLLVRPVQPLQARSYKSGQGEYKKLKVKFKNFQENLLEETML